MVHILEHGEVFTFGDGANGQLGHGNKLLEISEPYAIKWNQPTNVVQVSCGEGHTALISGIGCYLYFAFVGKNGVPLIDLDYPFMPPRSLEYVSVFISFKFKFVISEAWNFWL